ncbi:hypothetical protein H6F95_30320 [Cyanobacteria bacterium FACHB-471]|nr:hypothetical protein [Cyanobacteria bacterium FACHB-471]
MKRLWIALGGLLLSVVSGYSLYYFSLSARAVVRRELSTICPEDWTAKDFHLIGTQTQSQETIAIYRLNCFDGDSRISRARRSFLGYEVLERKGLGWRSPELGSHLEVLPEFSQEYVEYGTVNRENQQSDRPAMIYGEILSPDVTAIEVIFDTGESLRQENKDGVFAIASPEATEVREIRVLGENGQILQRDTNRLPTVYTDAQYYVPVAPSSEDIIRHSYFSGNLCLEQGVQEASVLGDFRILRTLQPSPNKKVVFFKLLCRSDDRAIQSALIGMKTVDQRNLRWWPSEVTYSKHSIDYDANSPAQQSNVWIGASYIPFLNFHAPFLFEGKTLSSNSFTSETTITMTTPEEGYTFYFGSRFGCRDLSPPAEVSADENYSFYSGSTFEYRDLFAPDESNAVEVTFSTGETLQDQIVNGFFSVMLPKNAGVCQVKFLGSDGRVLAELG